jgi:hypothetical protein
VHLSASDRQCRPNVHLSQHLQSIWRQFGFKVYNELIEINTTSMILSRASGFALKLDICSRNPGTRSNTSLNIFARR